jgi:hypothetical protein
MARDQDPKTARLYDRRTVERNIKKGLLTRKDWEKHLKSLEDVAEKGVYGGSEVETVETDADEADTEGTAGEPGEPEPTPGASPAN